MTRWRRVWRALPISLFGRRRSAFHPPTAPMSPPLPPNTFDTIRCPRPPPVRHLPILRRCCLSTSSPLPIPYLLLSPRPLILPPPFHCHSSTTTTTTDDIPPNSCPRPHLRACQPSLASSATVTCADPCSRRVSHLQQRARARRFSAVLDLILICTALSRVREPPALSALLPSSTMTTAVANHTSNPSTSLAPARHPSPRHFSALARPVSSVSPPASAANEPASKRQRSNASPPSYGARSNSNERSTTGGKVSPNSYVFLRVYQVIECSTNTSLLADTVVELLHQ